MAAAYQWHNYGDATIGPRSDIECVPIERLQDFDREYYQPDNAMLIIAGKPRRAKAFKWVADSFGKIPKPKRVLPATYTVEPTQDGERTVTIRRIGGTGVLFAGYHVPAGTDPDFPAVLVLQQIWGDSPSGTSTKRSSRARRRPRSAASPFSSKTRAT